MWTRRSGAFGNQIKTADTEFQRKDGMDGRTDAGDQLGSEQLLTPRLCNVSPRRSHARVCGRRADTGALALFCSKLVGLSSSCILDLIFPRTMW